MQEIRGPAGRTVWDKLAHVNEAVLASYLKNEYPQTAAVVLTRIEPAHAARVLTHLPDDFATEVVIRMLRMEVVQTRDRGRRRAHPARRVHEQPRPQPTGATITS